MKIIQFILFACFLTLIPNQSRANCAVIDCDLEELSQIKIYSSSKRAEDPYKAPSAIFVISKDDIQKMGVNHIAEALRAAPGLHVAQQASGKWTVTARGFSGQFANKLLILVDGREVFSPLFSGVFWDRFDYNIEDIKQIEVIRGPAASIWGANAVNGVINIITEKASKKNKDYVSLSAGTLDKIVEGGVTNEVGDNQFLRTSFKLRNRDDLPKIGENDLSDDWNSVQLNFRYDDDRKFNESKSLYGGFSSNKQNTDLIFPTVGVTSQEEVAIGAYLTGRWQKTLKDGSDLQLQSYLDYNYREFAGILFRLTTFDVDGQYDTKLGDSHSLTIGAGYRGVLSDINDSEFLNYEDTSQLLNTPSMFIQDTIELLPNSLSLVLGSKFEHNNFSGFEYQPSARLAWEVDKQNLLWASVGRAVRTPSIGSEGLTLQFASAASQIGSSQFESEEVITFEVGLKTTAFQNKDIDFTIFYSDYDNLRTFEPNGTGDFVIDNQGSGSNFGAELSLKYQPILNWDLNFTYSFSKTDLNLDPSSNDSLFFFPDEGRYPEHQFSIISGYRVSPELKLNGSLFYVSELEASNIDAYARLDLNIEYTLNDLGKVRLIGQNLLDPRHQEFSNPLFGVASEVPRSFTVQWTTEF